VLFRSVRNPPRAGPLTPGALLITTTGTYTSYIRSSLRLYALLYGGGGGGAGNNTSTGAPGAGGGSGAVVFGYVDLKAGDTLQVTVGTGGAGGASGSAGGAGQASTLVLNGTTIASAGGGGGGAVGGTGGAGGTYSRASPFVLLLGINGNKAADAPSSPAYSGTPGANAPDASISIMEVVKGVLIPFTYTQAGGAGGASARSGNGQPGSQPGGGGGGAGGYTATSYSGGAGGAGLALLIIVPS
jgi:hypothetical protein